MKKYNRLFIILALSILTIFALLRLGNIDISAETLGRVHWSWFWLVFAIFYASILARGWRWRRILRTMGWPVNFVYAQTLLMAGLFISAILPARAGDIGRVAMLKRDYNIPVSQGIASIATERALDVFSILILAIIGAIWALQGRIPPDILKLMIGAAILFVIGLIGLLAVPSFETWLRQPGRLQAMVPASIWALYQKILDFGFSLIHGVRALGRNPVALTLAIIESLFIWLCDALLIHFILISIGAPISLAANLFVGMISDLAAAVPLVPGALVQFDAVLVGTLALFGVTTAASSLTTLLLRFVNFWTHMLVSGLITYLFGFSRALNLNRQEIEPDELTTATAATPNPVES